MKVRETNEGDDDPSAGNTPQDNELLTAAWEGDAQRVKELVALGADLESLDKLGNTPLHLAIENLNVEVVRVLIEAGADVNKKTADGSWTPLAHACDAVSDAASQLNKTPDNELLRLLVAHGADVDSPTWQGLTPLELLGSYLNKEAEAILMAAGARRKRRPT